MPVTTTPPARRKKGPRGYLLMEVTIAGAITAIMLAGIFTELARSRALNAMAAREVTASQVVLQCSEKLRAIGIAATNASCNALPTPAGFTRTVTSTTGNEQMTTPTGALRNIPFAEFTVKVQFTVSKTATSNQ